MLYNKNDQYVGRSLRQYGEYCNREVSLYRQLLRPGFNVIEVGANINIAYSKYFPNKFSNYSIEVTIQSDEKFSEILIQDDGPGFPEDIIDKLGEPYIRTSSNKDESMIGLGLGTFIGKTLLEKNNAKVEFKNVKKNKGALVKIVWLNENLKKI